MENEDPDTGRITWPKKVRNGVPDPDLFGRGTGDAEKMTGIYRGSCMVQWKISALPLCYYRYSQGHEDRAKRKGGIYISGQGADTGSYRQIRGDGSDDQILRKDQGVKYGTCTSLEFCGCCL